MLVQIQIALLLLATHAPNINTAGHGPETTVLGYISEFLNSAECHELYLRLATPHKEAEQPPEEKDLVSPHQQQAISNMEQCKESLSYWLEMQRGQVDWDRLARALRQIGRPDVSRELKKRLTMNRSLEPKGSPETNQTEETPESAAPVREKAPSLRTRQGPIQKSGRTFLDDKNEGLVPAFLKLFPQSWHNPTLQQYILPATKLLLTSFLAGLVVWLISVYYIICWNFGQCLFGSGLRCGGAPAGQNMNLTVIWNRRCNEDRDDLDTTEEEEEEEVSEKEP